MSYISTNLNFLINTVKKIGNSYGRDYSEMERLQSSLRGQKEFAKSAYSRVCKDIRAELQYHKPDYAVVFAGETAPNAPHFLVSPLDGVVNFMHAIPYFSLSIAMVENGSVICGVTYNPVTSDLYFAEKGNGAYREGFRNHERLRVSNRKELPEALIGAKDYALSSVVDAVKTNHCLSLDLAYLASGKLDAVVSVGNSVDTYAVGLLLVKEAGGMVFEQNQKDIRTEDLKLVMASGNMIAANANLGQALHKVINK